MNATEEGREECKINDRGRGKEEKTGLLKIGGVQAAGLSFHRGSLLNSRRRILSVDAISVTVQ